MENVFVMFRCNFEDDSQEFWGAYATQENAIQAASDFDTEHYGELLTERKVVEIPDGIELEHQVTDVDELDWSPPMWRILETRVQ